MDRILMAHKSFWGLNCFHCFHEESEEDWIWPLQQLHFVDHSYHWRQKSRHWNNSMQYSNIIFPSFKPLWKNDSHQWSIFALRWSGKELRKYESSSRKYSMWCLVRAWGAFGLLLRWIYQQGKGENRYHDLQVHQSIIIHANIWVLFPSKQETQQQDVPDRGGPGLNLRLHHRLPLPEPWA